MHILVIHGPNLNLLGIREPEIYGATTLPEIDGELSKRAQELGATVECFQSNIEGEIVSKIQDARGKVNAIIINPAAYTHTSVAIRDALLAVGIPAIEVHLSNLHKREPFRRRSLTAAACVGQISGLGGEGYYLALQGLVHIARER